MLWRVADDECFIRFIEFFVCLLVYNAVFERVWTSWRTLGECSEELSCRQLADCVGYVCNWSRRYVDTARDAL